MSKPAFPLKDAGVNDSLTAITDNEGMTLLEYYAGQALIGLSVRTYEDNDSFVGISELCFEYAEAMIKEAEKRSQ